MNIHILYPSLFFIKVNPTHFYSVFPSMSHLWTFQILIENWGWQHSILNFVVKVLFCQCVRLELFKTLTDLLLFWDRLRFLWHVMWWPLSLLWRLLVPEEWVWMDRESGTRLIQGFVVCRWLLERGAGGTLHGRRVNTLLVNSAFAHWVVFDCIKQTTASSSTQPW